MEKVNKTLDNAIGSLSKIKDELTSRKYTVFVTHEDIDLEVKFDECEGYCGVEAVYIQGVDVTSLLERVPNLFDEIVEKRIAHWESNPSEIDCDYDI